MGSAEDRAGKYLQAARSNQEQLWKRRQIQWRTNFGLWSALALGTGFIYVHMCRPIAEEFRIPIIIVGSSVCVAAVWFHFRHLKACFISDEMDLDFINYYKNRAEWELDNTALQKPSRPEWADKKRGNKWTNEYYSKRKNKMTYLKTPLGITILISTIVIALLIIMVNESDGQLAIKDKSIVPLLPNTL